MAATKDGSHTGLPTRVTLLEHGVQELKEGLDEARSESRESFSEIKHHLTLLSQDIASRARPTNWVAMISAAAAAVVIISSVFGLAEWRVSNAQVPLQTGQVESNRTMDKLRRELVDTQVQVGIEKALREYRERGSTKP